MNESQQEGNESFFSASDSNVDTDANEKDETWEPGRKKSRPSLSTHTKPIPRLALECDKTGVSSRVAAQICNAYAIDMGWLTYENKETCTIDKNKIDNWRSKGRVKINEEEIEKN